MSILIVGKAIKNKNWKEINDKNQIGQYYSSDRYFTLLNEFIDTNLKKHAKFVFFIITYLMRSNNFRHETSIANGKSIWVWLVDIFCWICTLAFLVCLFTGIAAPIVQAIKDKNIIEAFNSPIAIGLVITALFTFIVAILYIYMMTKVVAKNKKLNLQDYVFKKIDYIEKTYFLIKVKEKIFKLAEQEPVIVEKADDLNNINRWTTLQVNNLLFKFFDNFNIILRFETLDQPSIDELKKIIDHDFKNITIIDLNDIDSEKPNSKSKKNK